MGIFFIQYESIPFSGSSDYEDTGGAYINCWVRAPSLDEAKDIALRDIEENKWKVVEVQEAYKITRDFYEESDESLECYQQAELDGECYVYHRWPNEAQEEDEVH